MEKDFAALLRRLRKSRGVSQEALALHALISVRTLRYWESGEKHPRGPELESVLAALDATPEDKRQAYALIPRPRIHRLSERHEEEQKNSPAPSVPLPHLGDLIRSLRMRQEKTQPQVAAEMDVALTTLIRWETLRNFPTEENLSRLCLLLHATPEEAHALAFRRLAPPVWSEASDMETYRAQFTGLVHLRDQHSPVIDLHVLSLKRKLRVASFSTPETRHLLAQVEALHSTTLFLGKRFAESNTAAQNALALFSEERQYNRYWGVALNHRTCFVGRNTEDYLTKAAFLLRHFPNHAPPPVRMRVLCDLAFYFSRGAKKDEARRLMQQAKAAYEAAPHDEETKAYFSLTHGRFLLMHGQPEQALQQFTSLTYSDFRDAAYLCYQAEAAIAMGEKGEGSRLLEKARAMVALSPYKYLQGQINGVAQRL